MTPGKGPGHSHTQHTQVSARHAWEPLCLCPPISGGGLETPAPPSQLLCDPWLFLSICQITACPGRLLTISLIDI